MTQNTIEADYTYGGRPDSELSREQIIDRNLRVVDEHFHNENPVGVEKAIAVYGDEIAWEGPARGVVMTDKDEILGAYRGIFRTLHFHKVTSLRRFATEQFVFDDMIGDVTVVSDEMANFPYPKGTRLNSRLAHLFELKDGKIINEIAYEMWREAGSPAAVDRIPEGSTVEIYDD